MKQNIVRLVSIEIDNVKNVKHGKLELVNNKKGNILGIYGQNGSGKTVVVDCMVLLKCLFSGKKIPSQFYHYINSQSETAHVKYCFEIDIDLEKSYAEYEVELLKTGEFAFCINKEKLSIRENENGRVTRLTPVFDYQRGGKELFHPQKFYKYYENKKNMDDMIALGIARQATENFNEEKQRSEVTSFLFSKKAQDVFAKAEGEVRKIYRFSNILQNYGLYDLAVIENEYYALLSLNLDMIPINLGWSDSIKSHISGIMLKLTDVNVVSKEIYPYVVNAIEQINIVMKALIPEIQIKIYNDFNKLMENGKDGIQFEIIALREGSKIPLLYESAGIKKLISICCNLVACYNRESYCLVIDELDSGIYEYLLGECLEVMQEKAKGQLIFTSHNLRPLEILRNDLLIYTTVNPENRYIKSTYIKNTQNTRLSYLRSIKLGGQKEKLYNETNIYEMELAMRRAGRVGLDD